jgi:hypothetical protein
MVFCAQFNTEGGMMALFFNTFILAVALVSANTARAEYGEYTDKDYLTVTNMKVQEISTDILGHDLIKSSYQREMNQVDPYYQVPGLPNMNGEIDPAERAGKIIGVARDLVALGEDVYQLVIKGKPTNKTTYAPISIIPRINGEAVDILATETWRAPVKKTYQVVYENTYGMDVVTFRYSVIYSYGGSYEGKGAYLTAVQVVPETVRTLFGFDFTATMKLGGIQNQGTRDNPIAGATILMEYTVSSLIVANTEVDSFFVTGVGGLKKL